MGLLGRSAILGHLRPDYRIRPAYRREPDSLPSGSDSKGAAHDLRSGNRHRPTRQGYLEDTPMGRRKPHHLLWRDGGNTRMVHAQNGDSTQEFRLGAFSNSGVTYLAGIRA